MEQQLAARRGRPPRIRPEDVLAAVGRRTDPGWTMAAIAAELGVSEAALYHYFPTKQAVLEAFGRAVLADLRVPDCDGDWAGWLRALFLELYDVLTRYPALTDLRVAVPAGEGPDNVRLTEVLLGTLVGEGFDVGAAGEALVLLLNLTWSYAVMAVRSTAVPAVAPSAVAADGLELTSALYHYSELRDVRALFARALDTTLTGLRTSFALTGR